MVKHIVMFKLTEKTSENMELATNSLRSLEGKIETLKSIEIGTDFLESDRSYDIVLTTHFESKEGLKIYFRTKAEFSQIETFNVRIKKIKII